MDKVLFSHNTDHWATPKWLYNLFIDKIDCIDPCPLHSDTDNLKNQYRRSRLFINLPYSAIDQWVGFIKNNKFSNIIFLLIPSRTDTKYFNDSNCAPFPSVLLIFGNRFKSTLCLNHNDLVAYLEDTYATPRNANCED